MTPFLAIPILASMLLPANPVGPAPYMSHVRVRHDVLAPILREAIDNSATIRDMVAALDASDVFVYFELQPGMPASLPAGLSYAGSGGRFRYLRIALNPLNTRAQMILMMGHELQHAVEVAAEPKVRSRRDLEKHYKRIGIAGRKDDMWDTEAARNAGRRVFREVARSRALARAADAAARSLEQP